MNEFTLKELGKLSAECEEKRHAFFHYQNLLHQKMKGSMEYIISRLNGDEQLEKVISYHEKCFLSIFKSRDVFFEKVAQFAVAHVSKKCPVSFSYSLTPESYQSRWPIDNGILEDFQRREIDGLFEKINFLLKKKLICEFFVEEKTEGSYVILEYVLEKQVIIGLTGTFGSGKDEVIEYLHNEYGFVKASFRDFFKAEMQKQGIDPNRDNLKDFANKMRADRGGDYVIKRILDEVKGKGNRIVFGSIRTPIEAEYLHTNENMHLVSVDAGQEIRYERVILRGSSTDRVSFEEFKEQEVREMANTDRNKQNLGYCMALTDEKLRLVNEGTLKDFHLQIDSTMQDYFGIQKNNSN